MIPSNLGAQPKKLSSISGAFAQLRDLVISDWVGRVTKVIPAAAKLARPTLTNTLPVLYDDIAQALTPEYPRDIAATNNNLGMAHGRDRAASTDYTLPDIVRELQIFRTTIFDVALQNGLQFGKCEQEVIDNSIDAEIRESIESFSQIREEAAQMSIARLAHDLRNPLHIATGAVQLYNFRTKSGSDSTLLELAFRKLNEVDVMIQGILDTATIARHRKIELKMEPLDIKVLAEEICAEVTLVGRPCQVIGTPVFGFWSRKSLKRSLENLLSNAEKYGYPDTVISVHIKSAEGRVLLAVHNEGNPIPQEQLPRLFTSFERGLEEVDVKGWGLGLAYVQQVAESHGGTVIVDSALERGTTFTLSIPIDCRPQEE